MSFHEQNLDAFIELLKYQRSLFSAEDRANLKQLIAKLPNDVERISEAVAGWYEQRPKVLDAQLDAINSQVASRSVAKGEGEEEKPYREQLLDAIGR
ncbi:hypothetical protein [Kamptonema formosum]|uniref:hypothetical protein n=1 Tax=Kamptonema formosum TaxID=331992 RepID=UPI0003452A46|nr:hypothetical protein [Oscillatoria sp. PCC 10802]